MSCSEDLRVERADLDGAEPRVRAQLPPEPRVVGDVGRAHEQLGALAEIVEVAHRTGHSRARPAAHRDLARGGQAGIAPVAKGRVRGERLQQRKVATQPVERAYRRVRVGHADMDVQPADGRRDGVAEQLADSLVALLVGDLGGAFGCRGVRARAEQPGAGREHGAAELCETFDDLARAVADVGDQLDLTRMQLALDLALLERREALLDGRRRIRLAPADGVDEEQLLLGADGVRRGRVERVLDRYTSSSFL